MTVVVDKFSKLQEMIDRLIKVQEMAAQFDNLREQQINELQRKIERLWYAVVAIGTIMAVHILYHVVPPLMDFFFGL